MQAADQAANIVVMYIIMTAALGWSIFFWTTRGWSAWRLPLAGPLVIGAIVSVVASTIQGRRLAETLFLALLCGGGAAFGVDALNFGMWIRDKGIERRDRERER